MADCLTCKCQGIAPGVSNTCELLHTFNDNRVQGITKHFHDGDVCKLPEVSAEFIYAQWCLNKNLLEQACWLWKEIKGLEYD